MKYLITGGLGFIGSNLILDLLKKGHQVLNLDKLTYAANREVCNQIPPSQYQLLVVDLAQLDEKHPDWGKILAFQPDYLVHLAAESAVDKSLTNNRIFFESNILGTWALLELLKQLPVIKAVFFETDEVYGSLDLENYQIDNYQYGFRESDKLDPKNPYAGSKAAAAQVTLSYQHAFGLPICPVRPTNNFGGFQADDKLIPRAITRFLRGEKIPVYGNGIFYREWIYVTDTVSAVEKILEMGEPQKTYNIGTGERHSNIEVIENIAHLMGLSYPEVVEFIPDPRGRAHDAAYAVDSTEVRKLGWAPKIGLEKGLEMTIDFYREVGKKLPAQ